MTDFLNRERYVAVADLPLGRPGTYTDYEEMALRESDPEWFGTLREHVAQMFLYNEDVQEQKDMCDLVFFNSVHVLYWWEQAGTTITDEMVLISVETSAHMLNETLTTEWLIRSGDDWKELGDQQRQKLIDQNRP